jgi:hypothetical protein
MRREISLSNVISNRIFDNEWRDMTEAERDEALTKIKEFLLSTCRGNSQVAVAIRRMGPGNFPRDCGILGRLTTEGYCAGQDYPGELRFVKNWIKKYCY